MNAGKDLLLSALRGEVTPRPAWVPFVGVHGGYLIGEPADVYLHSASKIVSGLETAWARYRPDGLPVVFDLQLEAEVLGCTLRWAADLPPSVTSHPLTACDVTDLPAFDLAKGRFPAVGDACLAARRRFGDEVALYGLATGPLTLLSHLRGTELFLDLILAPDRVHRELAYCARIARAVALFYLDHGADVVAFVDPMTTQISRDHFVSFVTPALREAMGAVEAAGGLTSIFVCGDATRNLSAMLETGCNNVQVDENVRLAELRELAVAAGKSFGGNLQLAGVLLLGTPDDAVHDALRCMDAAGHQGFVLAPGCDLPYQTPPENLEAVAGIVHDALARETARSRQGTAATKQYDDIELPDYAREPRVIIDIITLDSGACAPCYYMCDAARRAAARARAQVTVREHTIKSREGYAYMAGLGVRQIPTLCIDGVPAYQSIIPNGDALVADIEARHAEKHAQ